MLHCTEGRLTFKGIRVQIDIISSIDETRLMFKNKNNKHSEFVLVKNQVRIRATDR